MRRPQKIEKISHFILTLLSNFKARWDICFQILWLSHNIRTLPYYESVGSSCETYKLRILCAFAQRGQKLHEFAIDYIFLSSSRASKVKLWTYTYAKDWMLLKKSMDHIMFWIDTQRRWCTLTSYNYLGQFNNFNKLRQYDWSNFWSMFLYIQLLLRKI